MYRSRFLAGLMIRMGYDAVAVGESELAYDLRAIREDAAAGLPVICANLYQDGARVFPPFVVRESGGARIGILALLGEEPPEPGRFEVRDPLAEGERALEELRGRGCDAVILVAHMRREHLAPLIASLDGIDLVIRGHALRGDQASSDCADTTGHSFLGHGVPVLFAGDKGRAIGRAVLTPGAGGGFALTDTMLVALPKSAPQDTAVVRLLGEFRREETERVREISVSEFVSRDPVTGQLRERYLGMETCGRCHRETADDFLTSPHYRTFKRLTDAGEERNPSCLPCHTTGYLRFSGYDPG
ncbi:MAG: multiheme c-type cytochrome, partial [Candidatus Krumholzibacteria bacterium]|nr:multiheme c-type cytochrome [Candidatus Krumholzibacteria bacterium]